MLLASACGSSSDGSQPGSGLYDTWIYSSGNDAEGFTFKTDNTYLYQQINITSGTTANDYMESGVIALHGSNMTITPQKWSCAGPDAPISGTYSVSGNTLDLAFGTRIVALQRDTTL